MPPVMAEQVLTDAHVARFSRHQGERPEPTWNFGDLVAGDEDLVAAGADLSIGTLIDAYAHGFFPMPLDARNIGWWSPVVRGIIPIDGLVVSSSLRKSCRRYDISVDTRFRDVMRACADPRRPHGWINNRFIDAYEDLHRAGWAHSIEVLDDGELVGGVYGVHIGRFFAGESMFHTRTDASKVSLVALIALLQEADFRLFDVQWTTPHLVSLGAIDVPRADYLQMLGTALNR
jgi:leucyl/phenylalanyl-tRNA---protein transferase